VVERDSTGRLAERDACGTWLDLGESSEVDLGGVGRSGVEEGKSPLRASNCRRRSLVAKDVVAYDEDGGEQNKSFNEMSMRAPNSSSFMNGE